MRSIFNLYWLFFAIAFSFIGSCSSNEINKKPTPFIEREEFIEIIYDVNILEGGLSNLNMNQDLIKDSAMTLYNGIFEKYNIDFNTFKANQEYYVLSDKYKEVSERVLEKIKLEEEKYKNETAAKNMSFIQFSELLEGDKFLNYFNTDKTKTYVQRLDSALVYYRINKHRLASINMDSVSFELNVRKLKKGADLFQLEESVFKKNTNNE